MKSFLIKVIIYSLPIFLVYVFPFAIYSLSKEYISVKDVIDLQYKNPETLYGFSYYGEPHVPYKMLLLKNAKPDVFVLGTSRSFQIRKEFFVQPDHYLNAAVPRPFSDLSDMNIFINTLPNDGKNRVLFLLLDKRYFTEEYKGKFSTEEDSFVKQFKKLAGKPLRLVYLDYFSHKYTLNDLVTTSLHTDNRIGLWALIADTGYRLDGTHKEGFFILKKQNRKNILDNDIEARVSQIKNYDLNLLYNEEIIIPKSIESLSNVLHLCKERNITVVGFIPPDPIAVAYEINKNESPYAQSQIKLTNEIAKVFLDNHSTFFNLSDIHLYNGHDEEFTDLIHGGDLLYAKLFLYMALQDSSLKKIISVKALQEMIKNTKGDFLSF